MSQTREERYRTDPNRETAIELVAEYMAMGVITREDTGAVALAMSDPDTFFARYPARKVLQEEERRTATQLGVTLENYVLAKARGHAKGRTFGERHPLPASTTRVEES